jgi:hypothetical protein
MNKFLISLSLSIVIVLSLFSCTKDNAQPKTDTVCIASPLGLWEGTFLTDQVSHSPGYFAFTFYSDSTLSRRTKNPTSDIYSKGSWKLANNKITFTDTTINFSSVVIQTGSFNYDAVINVLTNGKWQYTSNSTGTIISGTFSSMQKVK